MYSILLSNNHEFYIKCNSRAEAFIRGVQAKKAKNMQNTRILLITEC